MYVRYGEVALLLVLLPQRPRVAMSAAVGATVRCEWGLALRCVQSISALGSDCTGFKECSPSDRGIDDVNAHQEIWWGAPSGKARGLIVRESAARSMSSRRFVCERFAGRLRAFAVFPFSNSKRVSK